MIKRRGRQLDLAALGQSTVHRYDVLHRLPLQRQYFLLVFFCKSPVLCSKGGEARIALNGSISEPGQVEPDLKVQKILCGELAGELLKILSVDLEAALHQQLVIPGIGPNHGGPIDREVMADQKGLFLLAQIRGAPLGMLPKEFLHRPVADLFQLDQEGRREVESEIGRAT